MVPKFGDARGSVAAILGVSDHWLVCGAQVRRVSDPDGWIIHMPARHLTPVPDPPPAIAFAEVVRAVTAVARKRGLKVPVFRSPPRLADVDRTLRRRSDGQVVVAVRLKGRPFAAVQSDVIAGVVAVNGLGGQDAGRFRRAAWAAVDGAVPFDDTTSSAVTDGGGTIDLRDGAREPHAPPEERAVEARHATPKLGVA